MINDFLLKSKRNPNQEYTLHLFEKCNLACKFCWQDHKASEGVKDVRGKVPALISMIKRDSRSEFTINIMGGEIFADDIFDEQLSGDYLYLCIEVDSFVRSLGKKVTFNFVSNLVNNRQKEIDELFAQLRSRGLNYSLVTSYDPRGRFSKSNFDSFKNNIEYFSSEIKCISMLITKPVINLMLTSGGDSYFKYLYGKDFYIYFDYYSPADDFEMMMPSDDDLAVFFKFLVDHFPKVNPIREWIENSNNSMSCRSSKLLLGDGTECMCGNLIKTNKKVSNLFEAQIEANDNTAVELHFLNKYNCMECRHFNRCTLGCFVKHSFSKRSSSGECPFKTTLDYIESI